MDPSSSIPRIHRGVPRPSSPCPEVVDLLGAAALHCLSPAEQRMVELHTLGCQPCALELAELEEASALLAHAVPPAQLPEGLRARVLAAVDQVPPHEEQFVATPLPSRRRRLSPASWAAAASLVLALGTAAWAVRLETQLAALEAKATRYDRIVGVLASDRLLKRDLVPAMDGLQAYGSVYLDPHSRTGMVMVHDLPVTEPGRGWQLWYLRDTERVSGGMLRVGADGTGYSIVPVPQDLEQFERLGITQEPAGGSPAPTSPRLLEASL